MNKSKHPYSKKEMKEFFDFAKEMALQSGEILKHYAKKIDHLEIHYKKAQGMVSSADLASEKYIISQIQNKYPEHDILAEEMSFCEGLMTEDRFKKSTLCWVIDPLDGTHNFLSGLDYYAVCIAAACRGNPFLGIVYRPSTGEFFWALEGQGAYLEFIGQKKKRQKLFRKNNLKPLNQSLLATGFASEKGQMMKSEFELFKKIFQKCRGIRRLGSAAIDLCYVAKGTFDGFWERDLGPWDVAAASVIAKEAGVKLSTYSGRPLNPFSPHILAARPALHKKLKSII